jgi:hypothetical protein
MDPINNEGRIQTSVTVFLITLAASEVVIYTLCKIMAWYAHVTFYAQGDMNWIHETTITTTTTTTTTTVTVTTTADASSNSRESSTTSIITTDTTNRTDSHDPSWNDIQNALSTTVYKTASITKGKLPVPVPLPLSSVQESFDNDNDVDDPICPICLNDFGTLLF